MSAYYCRTVADFLQSSLSDVVGELALGSASFGFPHLEREQIHAWEEEVAYLKAELSQVCKIQAHALAWGILLEFPIPRRQQRIDAVLLAGNLVLVLEFKSGRTGDSAAWGRQVEDYALDLSYFHAPSHDRTIVPVLVAPALATKLPENTGTKIRSTGTVPPERLSSLICSLFASEPAMRHGEITLERWNHGLYQPVPSVIEAATTLYAGMSVREITRSHADAENLTRTTDFVLREIGNAQAAGQKVICFITGIPGAGKTLAGLNLVHNPEIRGGDRPASVFMSGNGPLVKILREALARDFAGRTGTSLVKARSQVSTFIQNVHHFVKDNLERPDSELPYEHAIVFDEAQRAWNAERNQSKHNTRSAAWHISEPEMVLKIMDRHKDWAVIIALVGGGQEIHEGEAGLSEWGKALCSKYRHWKVFASPEAVHGDDSVSGASLFDGYAPQNVIVTENALHLKTCLRSHQARDLATWVNRVIEGRSSAAAEISRKFERFPIVLTRDLSRARSWLNEQARGRRRCGLVASSGATRLRAQGIETSVGFRSAYPYFRWFLDDRDDVRSSYQLEVVATEFEIQGLELDIAGLCWGGDLVWSTALRCWSKMRFTGKTWRKVKDRIDATQIENKYRVLMTRAREGLVLWIPSGDPEDLTRNPSVMNETADFLLSCGVAEL